MAEYIEREAVIEFIRSYRHSTDVAFHMEEHLNELPAADVRERGKWDDDGCGWVRCSICRGAIAVARGGNRFNYCPNCGADMREEQT